MIKASSGRSVTSTGGRTFATVPGLRNGRPVTFTVTATDAFGTGTASGPSTAVTPSAPPPPDRPTTLHLSGGPRKLTLKAFLKGFKFSVKPSKPASLQISLLGAATRATIARSFNVTLVSKSLGRSAAKRTVKLVPARKLLANPRRAKVELVIVATDAAGSRSTTTRTISVSRRRH